MLIIMGMNQMNLKQQLVIWKRANYLLDNICITPKLCNKLLESGLIPVDLLDIVQAQSTETEKVLKLLTYLGLTHNDDEREERGSADISDVRDYCAQSSVTYFDKFLRALSESSFDDVAKELRRTEKHTKFGEILPPVFTYFMDTSQFLKQYSHIAVRLGEEEKHLLQTFIDGKLDMITRILNDKHAHALSECQRLNDAILHVTSLLENERRRVIGLEKELAQHEEENRNLNSEIETLRQELEQGKEDRRAGLYYRTEVEELQKLLHSECLRYDVQIAEAPESPAAPENGLKTNLEAIRLRLLRYRAQLTANRLQSEKHLHKDMLHELETLRSAISNTNFQSNPSRYRALQEAFTEVNGRTTKLGEDVRRLERSLDEHVVEMKSIASRVPTGVEESSGDWATGIIEEWKQLALKRYSPTAQLKQLLEAMQADKERHLRYKDEERERQKELYEEKIEELLEGHVDDMRQMRSRLRAKMLEVHRREMTLRKLKKQMGVISRLHSINLNTNKVSPEDCKKIVRTVIRETRILQEIFEDKEPESFISTTPPNQNNATPTPGGSSGKLSRAAQQAAKRPKKKKKYVALADDRLRYVADKLRKSWRTLGSKLDLTSNRMDMIELDAPYGREPQELGYAMLKLWRDEEGGISVDVVKALREMNRDDLASILIPDSRIEIITSSPDKQSSSVDNPASKPEIDSKPSNPEQDSNHSSNYSQKASNSVSDVSSESSKSGKENKPTQRIPTQRKMQRLTDRAQLENKNNVHTTSNMPVLNQSNGTSFPAIYEEEARLEKNLLAYQSSKDPDKGLWVGRQAVASTKKTGTGVRRPIYGKLRAPKLPRVQY